MAKPREKYRVKVVKKCPFNIIHMVNNFDLKKIMKTSVNHQKIKIFGEQHFDIETRVVFRTPVSP